MSLIEVKVPQLSESISEAALVTWHKQVGDAVTEGENLIDIETDKVVMDKFEWGYEIGARKVINTRLDSLKEKPIFG